MKNTKKAIVWLLIVLHLATAQSLETRDYVLSNKSEKRILNEILLDSNMTNKNVKIVRQSKSWTNKSKTRKLDVSDSRNTRTEIFEQKTIIDDYGNEKIVFVKSQLNINDTTTNTNRKITFSYETNTPEFKNNYKGKYGLTAQQKQNVKIGIFVPVVVVSLILVPALIVKANGGPHYPKPTNPHNR